MRYLLLITFLLFSHLIFSQKHFASIDIGIKTPEKLVVIPDEEGNICLFYKDLYKNYFSILDKEGRLIRTRAFKKQDEFRVYESFIGATTKGNSFVVFFSNTGRNNNFSAFTIGKKDTNDYRTDHLGILLSEDEKFIKAYTDNGAMHFILANKQKNIVSFLTCLNAREIVRSSFTLRKPIFEMLRKGDFKIIKSTQHYTVASVNYSRKLYVSGENKIIFTTDYNKWAKEKTGHTQVLEFDLDAQKAAYYQLPFNSPLQDTTNTNSFYHSGKLFRILTLRDALALYISDVRSGNLLKKYSYTRDNNIALISCNVVSTTQNTPLNLYDREKILLKNRTIFKELSRGKPSVAVHEAGDSTLLLLIGSLQKKNNSYFAPGFGFNAGTGAFFYTSFHDRSIYTTWFNGFLKSDSYEIANGIVQDPPFYRIEKYKESLKESGINVDEWIIFKLKDKTMVGYMSRSESLFRIDEIEGVSEEE